MGQPPMTVSSSTTCKTLDREELLARCLGSAEFAMRVLGKFQARLEQDLADVDQALQDQDWDLLAHLAHRIKGASASVSAALVRRRAAELEDAVVARQTAELPGGVERLHRAADRLVHELSELTVAACEAH